MIYFKNSMPIKYYIIILQMNKIGEYIYANFN